MGLQAFWHIAESCIRSNPPTLTCHKHCKFGAPESLELSGEIDAQYQLCTGVPDSPLAMHARICMHELICRDGKNFVLGDNIKFIPVSTAPRIDFHLKSEA